MRWVLKFSVPVYIGLKINPKATKRDTIVSRKKAKKYEKMRKIEEKRFNKTCFFRTLNQITIIQTNKQVKAFSIFCLIHLLNV